MSYESFDPRSDIRTAIGWVHDYDGDGIDESIVSVLDDYSDSVLIPLFLPGECRTGELPYFPYVEMKIMTNPSEPRNIQGDVKYNEIYIDFDIQCVDMDNITIDTFTKNIADEIIDLVTTDRNSVASTYHVTVIDNGHDVIEGEQGKEPIFHKILTIYANNYDGGT